MVSEILLHPNVCVYCISVESAWGERVLKTFRECESGEGASFPHALLSFCAPSFPGCLCSSAALLTNISLQGHSQTASLIFSRPSSLILQRCLLHLLSGNSTQKTWKRKKRSLYICVVAQEVDIGVKVSLFINTDQRLNLHFPFTLDRRFQSDWRIHLTHTHLSNLLGSASADDN